MSQRILLAIAALFACLGSTAQETSPARTRPNIVVIFTDDHGYADLSCQGIVDDIRTPHIDRLAAGGVRMTSGYVTAPQCVPSRAGLLSGRYQNRLGVESNGEPLDRFEASLTVAERLKSAGYATGMTGKWHLGPPGDIVEHGFDDVFYQGGSWTNFDLNGKDVASGTVFKDLYHLDAGSAAAKAFIKRHHDEPFFLYVAYRAPHVPLDPTKKYLDRFPGDMPERRRQALAMISAVDDGVGGVIDSLREFDLEDNTLIFFIGDNGAPLKIHKMDTPGGGPGWDGSLNDPLNGEKGMLSEGGIRVPFLVYWKGKLKGGQIYEYPVISLDVAATAVSLAGLPADPQLDGVDLIPYLTGENEAAPHDVLYWRWVAQSAIREGKWKLLRGGSREYLFDVEADREEKKNLLAQHPEVARRLASKLSRWASELQPPGLQTGPMSETWQRYFDHYLDGKLVPRPESRSAAESTTDRVDGWIVRQATFSRASDGLLRVTANRPDERPFIAAAGLALPANTTAVIGMRSKVAGEASISWREAGQKDFPPNAQTVKFTCNPSTETVEHRLAIAAAQNVIHVRLSLPQGGADIESITFQDDSGEVLKSWQFD